MRRLPLFLPLILTGFYACTPPNPGSPVSTHDTARPETQPNMDALAPEQTSIPQPVVPATNIRYSYFLFKDSGRVRMRQYTPAQKKVIYTLNRIDGANIPSVDTVIVPSEFPEDRRAISPFPQQVPALQDVNKIVLFSYPIQAFAAYEHGVLQQWGPTSMGRKDKPTPEGLYFANWKAEETTSTFDDEWELKWNFNIENKEGIGWHQYALPGKPASHSCLRLLESDAKWLYDWADMWVLKDKEEVAAQGTPTIVFGQYPWGGRRPWMMLLNNPAANNLSVEQVQQVIQPHMQKILEAQKTRSTVAATSGNTAL